MPLLSLFAPAHAFCGAFVGSAGSSLVNNSSEVVVARERNHTTLTLVMDYEGDAENFALLLPVPQVLDANDVSSIDYALLDWIADYSQPRLVEYTCETMYTESAYSPLACGGTLGCSESAYEVSSKDQWYADSGVTVESAFKEYGYEFVVLSAEESSGLFGWLSVNGYAIPEGGEEILQSYIDAGVYFLAAKIALDDMETRGDWLPPIQLSYGSELFGLPIRIGTISSDGEQEVVMYILNSIEDGEAGISNYREIELEDECMLSTDAADDFSGWYNGRLADSVATEGAGWIREYSWDLEPTEGSQGYHCDPCTATPAAPTPDGSFRAYGLNDDSAHLTRLRMRYTAAEATSDLVLYTSRRVGLESQIRFVDYRKELEYLLPICDVGYVDDPGTCPDPHESSFPWPVAAAGVFGVFFLSRRRPE